MKNKDEIVEREMWDHYSELPNPSWYEYKDKMKKKYPDNIVYNEESDEFDAKLKQYPTTVGSQKFEPIVVDKSDSISLIEPTQWDKIYMGTFILLNNGKWEKV